MTASSALAAPGARILLIGTGTHSGPTLTSVPAVPRSVEALRTRLIEVCGVPAGQMRTLIDPADARTMALVITEEAQRAQSALLIYYVGHGLIGPDDELFLAASGTDRLTPGLAAHQALPVSALREALTACQAPSVIVVLDCCFSGRASLGARALPSYALPASHGMYLLSSAEQLALAPPDAEYTAFTGELIQLLDHGDPRGPRQLTLDNVYEYLFHALNARGGPRPRRQAGDRSGSLVIVQNAAALLAAGSDETDDRQEQSAGRSPYPGLASFGEEDAAYFHGRNRLVEDLLAASARALDTARPLVVVGPSGAGKTSLLHAGLLPRLREGAPGPPGAESWSCIILTPGERPLLRLADELHAEADSLRADPGSAARLVRDLAGERRMALIVDQSEELFTTCRAPSDRESFVRALTAMAGAGVLVVLALRADFYGQAQLLPELADALLDNQVLAGPMRKEELRAAIEEPAAVAGLTFEDGLVDLLLHELGSAGLPESPAGVLPLLSHTLWATWRQRRGARLTVRSYRDSGGVTEAIATTADAVYKELVR
jgi:hypothetical protein